MKKLAVILSIAAAGVSLFAADASAQRIIVETPGRLVASHSGGGRAAYDLDRLNREVRQVRYEIRAYRGEGRRIWARYGQVQRAADRLNYEFDRRLSPPWQIRRRIEQVRAEIYAIREDLRYRGDRWDRGDRFDRGDRGRWDEERPRSWR